MSHKTPVNATTHHSHSVNSSLLSRTFRILPESTSIIELNISSSSPSSSVPYSGLGSDLTGEGFDVVTLALGLAVGSGLGRTRELSQADGDGDAGVGVGLGLTTGRLDGADPGNDEGVAEGFSCGWSLLLSFSLSLPLTHFSSTSQGAVSKPSRLELARRSESSLLYPGMIL